MDKAQASGWTSYSLQEGREVCKPRQSVPKPGLTATILVKEKAELNSCFNGFSVLVEKVKTNKQISGYITQLQGELWREIKQSKEHEKEALFWASVVRKAFLEEVAIEKTWMKHWRMPHRYVGGRWFRETKKAMNESRMGLSPSSLCPWHQQQGLALREQWSKCLLFE